MIKVQAKSKPNANKEPLLNKSKDNKNISKNKLNTNNSLYKKKTLFLIIKKILNIDITDILLWKNSIRFFGKNKVEIFTIFIISLLTTIIIALTSSIFTFLTWQKQYINDKGIPPDALITVNNFQSRTMPFVPFGEYWSFNPIIPDLQIASNSKFAPFVNYMPYYLNNLFGYIQPGQMIQPNDASIMPDWSQSSVSRRTQVNLPAMEAYNSWIAQKDFNINNLKPNNIDNAPVGLKDYSIAPVYDYILNDDDYKNYFDVKNYYLNNVLPQVGINFFRGSVGDTGDKKINDFFSFLKNVLFLANYDKVNLHLMPYIENDIYDYNSTTNNNNSNDVFTYKIIGIPSYFNVGNLSNPDVKKFTFNNDASNIQKTTLNLNQSSFENGINYHSLSQTYLGNLSSNSNIFYKDAAAAPWDYIKQFNTFNDVLNADEKWKNKLNYFGTELQQNQNNQLNKLNAFWTFYKQFNSSSNSDLINIFNKYDNFFNTKFNDIGLDNQKNEEFWYAFINSVAQKLIGGVNSIYSSPLSLSSSLINNILKIPNSNIIKKIGNNYYSKNLIINNKELYWNNNNLNFGNQTDGIFGKKENYVENYKKNSTFATSYRTSPLSSYNSSALESLFQPINKPIMISGRMPLNINEITISPQFAKANNKKIYHGPPIDGSDQTKINSLPSENKLKIRSKTFIITGLAVSSEYNYPVFNALNFSPNNARQTVIYTYSNFFVDNWGGIFSTPSPKDNTNGFYLSVDKNSNSKNKAKFLSDLSKFGKNGDGKLLLNNGDLNLNLTNDPSYLFYTRQHFVIFFNRFVKLILIIFTIVITLIAIFILFVIIKKQIKSNSKTIGILKALGYNNNKIAKNYICIPFLSGIVGVFAAIAIYFLVLFIIIKILSNYFAFALNDILSASILNNIFKNNIPLFLFSIILPIIMLILLSYFLAYLLLQKKAVYMLYDRN